MQGILACQPARHLLCQRARHVVRERARHFMHQHARCLLCLHARCLQLGGISRRRGKGSCPVQRGGVRWRGLGCKAELLLPPGAPAVHSTAWERLRKAFTCARVSSGEAALQLSQGVRAQAAAPEPSRSSCSSPCAPRREAVREQGLRHEGLLGC